MPSVREANGKIMKEGRRMEDDKKKRKAVGYNNNHDKAS